MPNAQVLSEKQAIVAALTDRMQNASCGVLVDYEGITVAQDTELRTALRQEDVEYTVIKNTLARRAIDSLGYSALDEKLNGTTSLATTTGDPIAPLRILTDYAKKMNSKFAVKAAFMENKVLSEAEIAELSTLSSKKDLQAQLIGAVCGPVIGLLGVLEAIIAKEESGEEPAAEAAAE
ncbi:MAG: 50S ribosomal protein L10 [Oscillospiraceae bacterium]|nr:50S ribosomal protein L10 [Oscillospiraceae bacterium]